MMSIPPLVMLAGIEATAEVVTSGIRSLQESFQQLFAGASGGGEVASGKPNLPDSTFPSLESTPEGTRIAQWARRQSLDSKLQQLAATIASVLEQAGVPFQSPIELAFDGNRLEVDAGDNPLPGQLEARLANSDDIMREFVSLRGALDAGRIVRVTASPGQGARLL